MESACLVTHLVFVVVVFFHIKWHRSYNKIRKLINAISLYSILKLKLAPIFLLFLFMKIKFKNFVYEEFYKKKKLPNPLKLTPYFFFT